MRIMIAAAVTAMAFGGAKAHLVAGSLAPKGGQSFKPGETVTVTWGVDVPHKEGIDVALSVDGGRTWTTLRSNQSDEDKNGTYRWTVPPTPTLRGRLRICQTEKSPKCTDADSVSRASGPAPYLLVSGNFTIQAAAGVDPGRAPAPVPRAAVSGSSGYRGHDLRGRRAESRVYVRGR